MRPYSKIALRRRVVVNLVSGNAFEGVLWDEKGPLLVLKNAQLLERGASPVPVDGEVLIERVHIDFVQVT